ncbi:hypothetical protein KKG41_00915 [Patescibacteria group bacterium]|nr:hypothetical protein [Patescibacteria group bacterium]MBU1890001.1 hypothetical protein [Patescibacteria group bacterium]
MPALRPTVFTSVILLVVVIGLFSVMEDNQAPDFLLVTDGVLWLTSNGDVYEDMKWAADYLQSHDIHVRAMYFEKSDIYYVLEYCAVEPKLANRILHKSGVIIDVRPETGVSITGP